MTGWSRADDVTYGSDRSQAMVAGTVRIGFGDRTSLQSLAAASSTQDRAKPIRLELAGIQEQARYLWPMFGILPARAAFPSCIHGHRAVAVCSAISPTGNPENARFSI
ncbi:hypothetical protein [Ruegeria arenilitoris]|uniref:hypothetical protein n=1 Tax=Ruegeria arenilitoris TaxID=1173585 RepID=UPI0020C2E55D|nr:hypothetical protein [Ruegeria arenilitoris]